jgi:hypothetical protein
MKDIYHFLHIGKTGGCAVIHALNPFRAGEGGNIHLCEHPTTFLHIPKDEQVIFNVRHPEKRFLSAFYYVKRHHWPREQSAVPWNKAEEKYFTAFATANEALEALSSPKMSDKEAAIGGMKHAWHIRDKQVQWVGGVKYLKDNIDRVFHVNFNESLAEDFAVLVEKLGLPEDVSLPTDKRIANIGASDDDDKNLSDLARRNLQAHYAQDYILYDYLKELKADGRI